MPDILDKYRYGSVRIRDKLHASGVFVLFHRNLNLDSGIRHQTLLFIFADGRFCLRLHDLLYHIVFLHFFFKGINQRRSLFKNLLRDFLYLKASLLL